MKKLTFMIIFSLIFIGACGTGTQSQNGSNDNQDQTTNEQDANYFEGYVSEVSEGRVLVTEKRLDQPYSEIDIEKAHELAGSAIYFSLDSIDQSNIDSFIIGEKVKIKHGAIAESYPGQGAAQEITRLVDQENDLIRKINEHQNIVELNKFLSQGEVLRKVDYTTEGDPIFTNIKHENDKYKVYVDATQDNFGNAEQVRGITCQSIEEVFQEGNLEVSLKECDNEGKQLLLIHAPIHDIVVPDQQYTGLTVNVDNQKVYETSDESEINQVIEQIKSGKKTSVMVMTLMKPDGTITLHGDEADLTYDYYQAGDIIAHNVFIQAGLKFE